MEKRDVVIQLGHCYRTWGATGTGGHRGTEQEFVTKVGLKARDELILIGVDAVALGADAFVPDSEVFVALHQDGGPTGARGASVGYPADSMASPAVAKYWKAKYQSSGWPSGFRPDNYTLGLRRYYGFRQNKSPVKFLIEHGFATNVSDADWMWDNIPKCVDAVVDACLYGLLNIQESDDGMIQLINDPNTRRMFATFMKGGTTTIREYSTYLPAAGEALPNMSYVIDAQIEAGNMNKVD